MTTRQAGENKLQRNLTNRHIQFIALGGAVGTGLFLGAGKAIFLAGHSVILAYLIAGLAVFLLLRQLGEMITEEPAAGSLSYFAYKYWGDFPGVLAGWNYWILYVFVSLAELTAVAAYAQYWFPDLATWKTALFFFVLINAINLMTVKAYGEIEFWFSTIKVTAICAMILTGGYILFFNPHLVSGATVKNLWQPASAGEHIYNSFFNGFFPYGLLGLITAIPTITFAFGGIELVGITAAETIAPAKTIPKAINQVVFRILIFYVGSISVLLSLYHWSNLCINDSPFVMIFDKIGFKYAAWTLNFVILTAALSVYNSCIYSNSRTLYGLALQNNAPQIFTKVTKKGVPVVAQILSAVLTLAVVPLNYFLPNWLDAFQTVLNFSVICFLVNWFLIVISHIKFRKQKKLENRKTIFPALFYPYANYFVLVFILFILTAMALSQTGMIKRIIAAPVWILLVYILYRFFKFRKTKNIKSFQ